jgi:hypothetical protein
MKTLKPELVLPVLAVSRWKNRQFTKMELAIIRHALKTHYVYPGDIPEDIVTDADRQGVSSNAWTVLVSLEILRMCKTDLCDEARGIVLGRKRNTNKKAKGRWTAVYELNSRERALEYLSRHYVEIAPPETLKCEQLEMENVPRETISTK